MRHKVMLNVPVLAPKELAFVDPEVRQHSLRTMCSDAAGTEDTFGDQLADSADAIPASTDATSVDPSVDLIKHVKKRRLYRQTTGSEVVWFPHDNSSDLIKELIWEFVGFCMARLPQALA